MFLDIIYSLVLAGVSPFLLWRALTQGKYRDHVGERFGRIAVPPPTAGRRRVWLHAVSLGEMRATRTLVPAVEAAGLEVVLSTNTETGRAEAGRLYPGRAVFYWPLDFSGVVAAALDRVRPDAVGLMELEFWPNFTAECARRGIPVVLFNGRLTERSFRGYAMAGRVVSDMFRRGARLCVQTDAYAHRFRRLGVDPARISVVANLKYDTADSAVPAGAAKLAADVGLREGDALIVAGSTGPTEEEALLSAYRTLRTRLPGTPVRLAIVPRHPHRFDEVAELVARMGFPLVRRSRPGEVPAATAEPPVILGDTMGELRSFYALCRAAFLGRSLIKAGGSDMTEAAALGRPTLFGPSVYNFEETASALLDAGAAVRVESPAELPDALARLLADEALCLRMGQSAAAAVAARRGATEASVRLLLEAMETGRPRR
jgi:3-deoxy-D-manno-octulosonic-acid transferase